MLRARFSVLAAISALLSAATLRARAGLVKAPTASVWFISPREFDVLHSRQAKHAECQSSCPNVR